MNNNLKASVLIITYNHEKYIGKAIKSALMQKTNFDYEIIIGEDFSTDNTRKEVIKYQKEFPSIVKPILNKKNLGQIPNLIKTLNSCKGQYIALLEGDDYWIDDNKLQKQVDFLDDNKDFSICSHNVLGIPEGNKENTVEWFGKEHRKISNIEHILQLGSGGATCSLVFRKDALFPLPEWFNDLPSSDWVIQALCTSKGKLKYFPEVMGVYRADHPNNSLAIGIRQASERGEDIIGIPSRNTLKIINVLDKHFNYKYSRLLNNQRVCCYYNLAREYFMNDRFTESKYYIIKVLKNIFGFYPYLSIKRIIILVKILLLFPKKKFFINKT